MSAGNSSGRPIVSRSPWITSVGTRAPRSSWSRDFSGRPGGCSGNDSARQPAAPRLRAQRAAERAPAERPPTTSGVRAAQLVGGRDRPSSRVAGGVATLRPATRHGCSNRTTVIPLRGRCAASASRSRASMPPPAPWLSSSVADGLPRPVGHQPRLAVRRRDDRLVRHARLTRSPRQRERLEQLGAVVADVADQRRDRVRLQPAGCGRAPAGRAGRPAGHGRVQPGAPTGPARPSAASGRGCGRRRPRPRW